MCEAKGMVITMRKAQKRQAESFLQTLGQAHEELKKLLENKSVTACATARQMLEDCQQGAIELGNMIEEAEGEGFATIPMLEEYCELTYQIHEQLGNDEAINVNKIYKSLRKSLMRIENSVKNDIKERLEVVFLPYKASMWDSLESVWKAADEDQECDAYVIPIPYYDKNPDGSFREMHYEGDEYPDYVPIVHYDNYNFTERRPDMIFIHNPYDNNNYVTSVHPFFYSKNLKQFTDKLVYIPYFIIKEISPNDTAAIESMKHFCTTPAVINADRVIVQSEDMRQIYIKVMMELTGGDDASRIYWEEKILGLGSPKVDKVINTRKEDLEIPAEWMRIIQRPDGSWKKIVFYNTSVSALLEYSDKTVEKIRQVLQVFQENQNEVALLWRPHPLIKATIESMRPQLWCEYQKIVEKYKEEKWGIYDDSANMNRAVVLSDAYYGDESSVLQLYKFTGKPTLLQFIWMQSDNEEKLKLQIEAGVIQNNKMYFSIPKLNKFFCKDLQEGTTQYLGELPEKEKKLLYWAAMIDDDIYFFDDIKKGFVVLNTNTCEIKKKYLHLPDKFEYKFLGKKYDILYFVTQSLEQLIAVQGEQIKFWELEEATVENGNNIFWVLERESFKIWKIDAEHHIRERAAYLSDTELAKKNVYSQVYYLNEKLVFVPDLTDNILIYDFNSEEFEKVELPEKTKLFGKVGAMRMMEGKNKKYLSSMFSSEIFFLDNKNTLNEIAKVEIKKDENYYQSVYDEFFQVAEKNELYIDLKNYLKQEINKYCLDTNKIVENGVLIWRKIK